MKEINDIDDWRMMEELLAKHGYTVFQFGSAGIPDFYYVRFFLSGRPDVIISTYDRKVEESLKGYSSRHPELKLK